ncbi:MAG: aldehyde ferredoxin oxidoreductase N-terminal domain-containing protein, partial [Nitrososphaerales archaeon]
MLGGYKGRILRVNLTDLRVSVEPLKEEYVKKFLGGTGIAAKILYDELDPHVDPLSPWNKLVFMTGPLTGTLAPGCGRFVIASKSPLTGIWGESGSAGYWGPELKFAGYDGIIFDGKAENPTYLWLNNENVELKDAKHLWGKDTRQTEDILRSELGRDIEVACIGQAGEKLSLISSVMSRSRAAARSGLGAVMGSKKLKAVVVRGKMKVPLADEKKTKELRNKYLAELGGHIVWLKPIGTPFLTVGNAKDGRTPVKNWGGIGIIDFPNPEPIGADAVIERRAKVFACYLCPIGCGGFMKAGKGEYKYEAG